MNKIEAQIIDVWSDLNPVAGYTGGHLKKLDHLFNQDPEAAQSMRERIHHLQGMIDSYQNEEIRKTADAVLVALRTQLDMARPSGAGPSGTGMGGVYAAADGVFYIVLKGDGTKEFVSDYLDAAKQVIEFETEKWRGQDFSILVRRECLDTVSYMKGTLQSLLAVRPSAKDQVHEIKRTLEEYEALFSVKGLDSDNFETYWPVFQAWDNISGPQITSGYPQSLKNYYQLPQTASEIETLSLGWLQLDLPVTIHIAQRITERGIVKAKSSLQDVWDAVSDKYACDFEKEMERVLKACDDFGAKYIIARSKDDTVKFEKTPSYLVNLVTGGEDFAINYLTPDKAYSQLYLTAARNTSLLTMINILVHEASHGYNFVLSAKHAGAHLLNLNTSLEVPMTEGMAYYREYQYWAAAQELMGCRDLNEVQKNYLELYGESPAEQADGILCAQLETYIWRIIRYIRALCDVRVNGGKQTHTECIRWASAMTGLSEEMLHGECFTLLSAPGYAPCYALGGATYAMLQKRGIRQGKSEINFNTTASKEGFYSWPIGVRRLEKYVNGE